MSYSKKNLCVTVNQILHFPQFSLKKDLFKNTLQTKLHQTNILFSEKKAIYKRVTQTYFYYLNDSIWRKAKAWNLFPSEGASLSSKK